MVNFFTFNDINSSDFGVFISGSGVFTKPERKVEKYSIPGRSGDLVIDEGAYSNTVVTYPAFIVKGFEHRYHDFIDALLSVEGYGKLQDTYQDRHFRKALFIEPPEPEVGTLNRNGKFELAFDCTPQRWLKDGERVISVDFSSVTTKTIVNPTRHAAKPLLYMIRKGTTLTITSGGVEYEITFNSDATVDDVYIDCEAEECYSDGELANDAVTIDWNTGFPRFAPGNTSIASNLQTQINCIPRWWDL